MLARALSSGIFRHGFLVLAATMYASLAAFLFHAVVSRNLGVAAYGSLYAVLSLVQLAALPANMSTTVLAQVVAEFRALRDAPHLRALARAVARFFGLGTVVYLVVGVVFASPIAAFLRVPSWAVILAALTAGVQILTFALRSIPQGTQAFRTFSMSFVIDATSKVIFGAVLTAAGFGLAGGMFGFLAGFVLGGAYVAWWLWKTYSGKAARFTIDWRRLFATAGSAFALTMCTAVLSYADVILVKHYFSPRDAGIYAAASLGGKIMFFLLNFAPMVLVPKAADRASRGENATGYLAAMLAMSVSLAAAGLLCFLFGGGLLLRLLVGVQFNAAIPLLFPYGAAMAALGTANVVGSYAIALHRNAFSIPLILIALGEIVTIVAYHPSLHAVLQVLLAANCLGLAAISMALAIENAFMKKRRVPDATA